MHLSGLIKYLVVYLSPLITEPEVWISGNFCLHPAAKLPFKECLPFFFSNIYREELQPVAWEGKTVLMWRISHFLQDTRVDQGGRGLSPSANPALKKRFLWPRGTEKWASPESAMIMFAFQHSHLTCAGKWKMALLAMSLLQWLRELWWVVVGGTSYS